MRKHPAAVKTGIHALDKKLDGLHPPDLMLVGGRPSSGKTALALGIAAHVAQAKPRPLAVALFSIETNRHAIMTRLIATQARVNLSDAKTGLFPRSKWKSLTDAAAKLSDAALYIDDSPKLTASSIRSRCEGLSNTLRKGGGRLGLVIIDFLQLIQGAQRLKPGVCGEAAARGAGIMQQLKRLAVDLRVPVIVLSQLRPAAPRKRNASTPEDFGNCDIPSQADIVAFVRQGPVSGKAALIIAKNPRGRTGPVPLRFSKDRASFTG